MATEFQPVIMAAGRGSRMTDLTAKCPKALLPVGNIPMILYPVYLLEKAGFEEGIVIVLESEAAEIKKALASVKIRLDVVAIPDGNYWGTADSLRFIKDKVKTDLLVISCDLITDLPLQQMANIHRTHDATVTMLLSSLPKQYRDIPAPGIKTKKKIERDFVGFDEKGERVLYLESEADLQDTVTFRKSVLKRHPFINIKSTLTDCHLYLMKKWIVDFLADKSSISSIKGELIPYFVKKQYSKPKDTASQDQTKANMSVVSQETKTDIFSFVKENEMSKQIQEMSSWIDHTGDMEECYHDNRIRCYAYIQQNGFCVRENTMSAYNESNKQIPRHISSLTHDKDVKHVHSSTTIKEKSQVGSDCLVAEGAIIGEKTSIKRSIVGKHCTIGNKVKLTNCVVMDRVSIFEGCNIQGSIIGSNSTVNEKCELKDCVVGNGQNINAMGDFTNEAIVDIDKMMEI